MTLLCESWLHQIHLDGARSCEKVTNSESTTVNIIKFESRNQPFKRAFDIIFCWCSFLISLRCRAKMKIRPFALPLSPKHRHTSSRRCCSRLSIAVERTISLLAQPSKHPSTQSIKLSAWEPPHRLSHRSRPSQLQLLLLFHKPLLR